MTTWRRRRCPRSGHVAPAGRFVAVTYGAPWLGGAIRRRRPSCGAVRATSNFAVVRQRRSKTRLGEALAAAAQ
ncbi:MAG: hypothetical protein HY691_16920 [Chloroflexi bacterium]|nr:hypothetical protein [Chloroflexota bacterium]